MNALIRSRRRGRVLLGLAAVLTVGPVLAGGDTPVLHGLTKITTIASTVPANGDVNPYGMAQVKRTIGNLRAGHILISNFNDSGNFQGTGTTIMDVAPDGAVSLFAAIDASALPGSCPGGVGLTTALVVLEQGWVIVGSLPTRNQGTVLSGSGCLLVLDSSGKVVETFYGSLINGPWDMTALDGEHEAKLFVTNVLNGILNTPAAASNAVVHQATVTRLNLKVSASAKPVLESITVIAAGFPAHSDPSALVIGPTGVALRSDCTGDGDDCGDHDGDHDDNALLYVADTASSRIAVIDHPLSRTTPTGIGRTLSQGGSLNAPLGMVITPGGHLLTVNGGDGFITEISADGRQIARFQLDDSVVPGSPNGAGTLFGVLFDPAHGVYFVDDGSNTVNLLHH